MGKSLCIQAVYIINAVFLLPGSQAFTYLLLIFRGAIGVQLTASARRHPALGWGTKRVAMGRPVCVSKSSREEAKKKKRRAPHNLAHVVSANIVLAKKH